MALTKKMAADKGQIPVTKRLKACLVTGNPAMFKNLKRRLEPGTLQIKRRLADMVGSNDCNFFIIDTKVSDMNIWPAPLLANSDTYSKPWLFLVSKLSDTFQLHLLPPDARFLNRKNLKISELIYAVERNLDPELGKRILKVHYLDNIRSFFVRMLNGKVYMLRISDLPEADSSKIARLTVAKDHSYFRVVQESGNWFEVPWDSILYNCEPQYEYYKGKEARDTNQDDGIRIGMTLRKLRKARGYTIKELAQRSGMKRPNLSRLEHGKHLPSLETLDRLADSLKVPVAEIISKKLSLSLNVKSE